MKKAFYLILTCIALFAVSCKEPDPVVIDVQIQLTLDGAPFAQEGLPVILSSGNATFEAKTTASGTAAFSVQPGYYTATSSFKQSRGGILLNYNGTASITVPELRKDEALNPFRLAVTASRSSQLIIKEVYNGGCKDNEGSKTYSNDKYIIVYNNSDTEVDASGMCLAMAQISNTTTTNKYAFTGGVIEYETAGWTPASYSIWWFQSGIQVRIAPYSQIVIAVNGAVDHTATYTNSVNLSNADYCLYDLESGFNNAAHYPAPSTSIPQDHYMKTKVFGMGTAWPFPNKTAAPFLIMPEGDIKAFVDNPDNFDNRSTNNAGNYAMIPTSWVLDAVDIWGNSDDTKSYLRFPSTVDNGYVLFETNGLGYSLYRNVDKAATEAIEDNAGKLVYNYTGAVDAEKGGDLSDIDAEASIANGAKIIYMDTNNSTNDFHLRKKASLKK